MYNLNTIVIFECKVCRNSECWQLAILIVLVMHMYYIYHHMLY